MKDCNKVKQTCGSEQYATCVSYEGTVNNQSSLINDSCISIEETTQDIYDQLGKMTTDGLGYACLAYTLDNQKITIKNVLKKYEEEICSLKTQIQNIHNETFWNIPIAGSGLDLKCLVTPCNTTITTVKELFQALIIKDCQP